MAHAARPLRMTVEEYLAFDEAAPEGMRYEYFDGEVVPVHGWDATGTEAMAGASPEHNQLSLNLVTALNSRFGPRGCRGGAGDQRVPLAQGRYSYPDLVFVCGEPRYSDDTPPTLLNPTLLVEIVSDSTVARDRGDKLHGYTRIESLQEYWIVEQASAAITRFVRQPDGWGLRFVEGLETDIASEELDVRVPLAEVYRWVPLA